jgi:hypothetical protein
VSWLAKFLGMLALIELEVLRTCIHPHRAGLDKLRNV